MGERKTLNKDSIRAVSAILIVIIVVVAAVVIGVGAYVATRHSSSSPSTTPSPAPSATMPPSQSATSPPTSATSAPPSSSATPTPAPTSTSGIATASSYEFNLTEVASNGTTIDTAFYAAKNLGSSSVEYLWIAQIPSTGTFEYIINGPQQKAWYIINGQVTDLSTEYTTQLSSVESNAGLYVNMLKGWGGSGSFTYTIPAGQPNAGDKAEFTNVQINPSLPDSLFQPPT